MNPHKRLKGEYEQSGYAYADDTSGYEWFLVNRIVELEYQLTHGRTAAIQIDDDAQQEAYKLGYIAGRIAGEQV